MKYTATFLVILLLPAVTALQFLTPLNATTYTGSPTVNFTWDQQDVNFSINGGLSQEINATNTSQLLAPGSYTATITSNNDSNATAEVSFTINPVQQPSLNITISTDQPTYEAGTSARIRITVSSPAQLGLSIQRDGVLVDAYTVNVQQQTDFLYVMASPGTYIATAAGQSSSASVSFMSRNTNVSAYISGSDLATLSHITPYSAVASGGTPPYTYFWQFSDNTSSTGAYVDHVFSNNGTANMTVLVQDSAGKQATASKQVTVTQQLYDLSITVIGSGNRLLGNSTVVLGNSWAGWTLVTDVFGEADFYNLSVDNYTLNTTYTDSRPSPAVLYNDSREVTMDRDQNLMIHFTVPVDTTTPSNSTNSTNSTTGNATNTTNTSADTAATTDAAESNPSIVEPAATQSSVASAQSTTESDLENNRADALQALSAIQATLSRSDQKQQILDEVELSSLFGTAKASILAATTSDELSSALGTIPKDVTIITKDTTITKLSGNHDSEISQFMEARQVPASEQAKYKYNIEQALQNTTVTTTRTVAQVTFYDASARTYTMFSRSTQAPDAMSFVEFVPKSIAQDASQLHSSAAPDILQSDPVLRFMTAQYSYYVQDDVQGDPTVLPVPLQLVDPPSLIGMVVLKLNIASFSRGGLYLSLLVVLVGIVVVGNLYLRRSASSSLPEFTELAELTISTIESDNYEIVAKHSEDLKVIHSTLAENEQQQTQPIMQYVQDASRVQEFRKAAANLSSLIELGDTAAIANSYATLMERYEYLSEQFQAQERQRFDEINAALETHVTTQETN